MLKTRVIPCLLLKDKGLVKTVKFANETYIGDPINAVRIFNDKQADELIFLDIQASIKNSLPQYDLIKNIASECFMPVSVGGGINSLEQAKKILRLGVEKIIFGTAAFTNPELIKKAASVFGSQAIVVSIDVKKDFLGKYSVYVLSASKKTGFDAVKYAQYAQNLGAGEIMLNNIDRDGTFMGFDIPLLEMITAKVKIPVIACGGARDLNDLAIAVKKAKVSAVAAGSLFVYHGRTRGILISYPDPGELEKLF